MSEYNIRFPAFYENISGQLYENIRVLMASSADSMLFINSL
jgi:hypothetical protein